MLRALSRRELWAEAGSLEDPELIALYAQNKLTDKAVAKVTLTADLIETGACRYGRDYDGRGQGAGQRDAASIARRSVSRKSRKRMKKGYRKLKGTFGDAIDYGRTAS